MSLNDKDAPIASDYKKSTEGQGFQLPDFLTSGTGVLIGLGIVVLIAAVVWIFSNVNFSKPAPNPLESHPGYASLKKQVENLAEVDQICAKADRTGCLCELADRIRDDHRAIDQILAADAGLKDFNIVVVHPGAPTLPYTLAKLPKAPEDADCLNTVSAPTIIDDAGDSDAAPVVTGAGSPGSPASGAVGAAASGSVPSGASAAGSAPSTTSVGAPSPNAPTNPANGTTGAAGAGSGH